ncbi:putative reverse transcriptase domain-containing protein [Tanacetum coccineum]
MKICTQNSHKINPSPPVTPAPNATTTTVTEAQLQALINQGVAAAMAEAEASRVRNGYDSNGSGPRPAQAARACSYSEFLKCKPLDFKGTEGVVGLTRWFEKMESVHNVEVAHAMPWAALKKMMTDKYCPRGEIKKIETEMWNLKNVPRRTKGRKIEKLSVRLLDMILGSVNASKSKTMQENNQNQQQQNRRQNTGQAYAAGNSDRKPYEGSKPLCAKCNCHHEAGPCPPRCSNCNRVGHLARDCRIRPANNNNNNRNNNNYRNNNNNQQGNGCFECGAQGHFKRNCPKLNNNDRGNQAGNNRAPAKVYAVGNAGANPDNVVAGTFLLNNRYAYILFDTGADRSFVSAAFSTLLDIIPNTLDHGYNVELADGRIIGVNTILMGCTLNFLNHPFNINLMPVEMGSFDVIIGMDWLSKYSAVIDCAKKIVLFTDGIADLPMTRPVSSIDLVPGAAPVARVPYRLAPSKMKELSEQLKELYDKGFIRPSSSPSGAPVLTARARSAYEDNIEVVEERGQYSVPVPSYDFKAGIIG